MVLNIPSQAENFVSHYTPEELREIRVYLCSEGVDLQRGHLTPRDLMILDQIKKKNDHLRLQILKQIEEVLNSKEVA